MNVVKLAPPHSDSLSSVGGLKYWIDIPLQKSHEGRLRTKSPAISGSGPGSGEHSCVFLLESLFLTPWLTDRICKLSPKHLHKDYWGHCTYLCSPSELQTTDLSGLVPPIPFDCKYVQMIVCCFHLTFRPFHSLWPSVALHSCPDQQCFAT